MFVRVDIALPGNGKSATRGDKGGVFGGREGIFRQDS